MVKFKKLAVLLSSGTMDGAIPLAALTGLFKVENALTIAIVFLAGPAAILTAALLEGSVGERMIAALLAGLVATTLVVFAAGVGPKLLEFLNVNVLKIVGGIAVLVIGFMIMGIKIPEKVPFAIMLAGVVLSAVWR